MTKFLYKAKDQKGKIVTGSVTADSEFDAEQILSKNMLSMLDLSKENQPIVRSYFKPKITVKDRAVFARQLATTVGAGVTLTKSMSILARQARNERLRLIFHAIYQDLEEGYPFSNALSKHPEAFDKVFVSVVKSGESSGNLEDVLNQLAESLESNQEFISKIRGALYYPIFIVIALVGIATYMMIAVIPRLQDLFIQSATELPLTTKILIFISELMVKRWWLLVIVLLIVVALIRYWLVSDSGSKTLDLWKIKLPIIKNLSTGLYMGRFARIMEMLVRSGVPILDALKIVSNTISNQVYEESINRVAIEVERGVPLSVPIMKNSVFPGILGQMIAVGEQTGKLDLVLDKVAHYYEQETSDQIKALSTLLEPIILLVVGMGVAFLIFSVLMPIYNIAQFQ